MATPDNEIRYWNRARGHEEVELVYGDSFIRWLYGTKAGQQASEWILSRSLPSKAYGALQASRLSRRKIEPFIREFKINMDEYEREDFRSFNDFFIRKFKPGRRPFAQEPGRMPAFAEARYLAWENIHPDQTFPVKGAHLTPEVLLGDAEKAKRFEGGSLMIARLCPVDYHRYHYPDHGRTLDHYPVRGKYHSVNPVALKFRSEIFATNERYVSILDTEHFGQIAYVEVGAMCVGKIVQSHPVSEPFRRGDEKGYFLFGGSTVIVLGEPGRWKPDGDILENTRGRRECFIRLGEALASAGK